MKFNIGPMTKIKRFHIDRLNGGIDLSQESSGEITALRDCKNVWLKDGLLKNRPGISTDVYKIIDNLDYDGYAHSFDNPHMEVILNEEANKIITEEIELDESHTVCITHFIRNDATESSRAVMSFSRADDSAFYKPVKMVFFKGKPQKGCGLFALVKLVNIENYTQKDAYIYELSEDFSLWERIVSTYIPTVYANGRGNMYEISAASNQAFKGTPTRLEKLNLLNGRFHAYYSSDGHSSTFRLPYSNIAAESVECKFYYSLKNYVEWKIPANLSSAVAKIDSVEVTMHIDRPKGICYFTVEAGDYEIPLISHQNENNIRITATKHSDYDLLDISDSCCAASVNSKILLGCNNLIFEADYYNPLYFPADSVIALGESDTPVTALGIRNGDIIAFKNQETHLITIKEGKAINTTSLLADNDSVFTESDTLTSDCISREIGCLDKNSLVLRGNQLFWRGADGHIYMLDSNKTITGLSEKIGGLVSNVLNPENKTFAANHGEYTVFAANHSALVLNYKDKNPLWYYWEFPEDLYFAGAFTTNGEIRFICKSTENQLCYVAALEGTTDTLLRYNEDYDTYSLPVNWEIRTSKIILGCENKLKKVASLLLNLDTQRAKISINDRLISRITRKSDGKIIKLITDICGIKAMDILIEGEAELALGSIDINYCELEL